MLTGLTALTTLGGCIAAALEANNRKQKTGAVRSAMEKARQKEEDPC